ncbi:MAG: hypothetical protein ACD_63C00072G0001 [uncultured bacterium]|nr:MAG: hypothetical protein ACD_63C00072G0001 [uncultured bacterium]
MSIINLKKYIKCKLMLELPLATFGRKIHKMRIETGLDSKKLGCKCPILEISLVDRISK